MEPPDPTPMRGKRSARAYHNESAPQQASPPMPNNYEQAQQPHPYANAPPPGPEPSQTAHLSQAQEGPPALANPSIPQPPHSAGQKLQGPRSRIDPNQIPSPVAVHALDQARFDVEPYLTCSRGAVPLALTDFIAMDQGNASPRFIRMSTYALPHSDDLAVAAQIPLGLVVQPFADLKPEEGDTVYRVDFGEDGPPRCSHCRSYINPWCMFVDGGQKFICNLCGGATDVTSTYFSHLDGSGRRVDLMDRPELIKGSIDFKVPKDYWAPNPKMKVTAMAAAVVSGDKPLPTLSEPELRDPLPMPFVFAIDVSWQSIQSGVLQSVTDGLKKVLWGTEVEDGTRTGGVPAGSRVAIFTFDRTVQFYNLNVSVLLLSMQRVYSSLTL